MLGASVAELTLAAPVELPPGQTDSAVDLKVLVRSRSALVELLGEPSLLGDAAAQVRVRVQGAVTVRFFETGPNFESC